MNEIVLEEILTYGIVGFLILIVIIIYLRKKSKASKIVEQKIAIAKEEGLHEPVSLHPVIDIGGCIQTGACIAACPEKDILGIVRGKATTINASQCIGHGACFHACPTEAISLCIGTEKRGVELPHVSQNFESNLPGISIAGELGGMGLIRNAVEQGKQASEYIAKSISKNHNADYDLLVVGAGPAGISATLSAKKNNLKVICLEQDSLGGTVYTFPRSKIVMTAPMDLPLYGKVRLRETSKDELLKIWTTAIEKNNIEVAEKSKVESIDAKDNYFVVGTKEGKTYSAKHVLLAIGRRGTPRKLNVVGEESEKVAYKLLEPEDISGKDIMVVGGGDSAIESAMLLMDNNNVSISYRKDAFARLKPRNREKIHALMEQEKLKVLFNTNVAEIEKEYVTLKSSDDDSSKKIKNDLVFIFAGGELPSVFLNKIGLQITKKYGEAVLKH
ncbi:MAG: NAD(P)-binding domain-containing protein [Chlorobi bacterium]|nr:NAD(P)-binding domain-containing protein [Chlorobiota bacterium]